MLWFCSLDCVIVDYILYSVGYNGNIGSISYNGINGNCTNYIQSGSVGGRVISGSGNITIN